MSQRRRIYEGKAKVLFEGPEPGTLVQHFKDEAIAFNNGKRGIILGKGVLNNRISEFLMLKLGLIGIPTHLVRRLNMREQLVREVEMIPVGVVVCNVAAGKLSRRLGIAEGTALPRTIIEYYYKKDELGDPLVSEEHITAFGWASASELAEIQQIALRVNDFLTGLFLGVNIRLVDLRLDFGRLYNDDEVQIVIADEIGADPLPVVGRAYQREDGQGPLPREPRPCRGGLSGGGAPAGNCARGRAGRFRGAQDDAIRVRAREGANPHQPEARGARSARPGDRQCAEGPGFRRGRRGPPGEAHRARSRRAGPRATARARVEEMCRQLLANPVIENYAIEIG